LNFIKKEIRQAKIRDKNVGGNMDIKYLGSGYYRISDWEVADDIDEGDIVVAYLDENRIVNISLRRKIDQEGATAEERPDGSMGIIY